MYYISFYTNTVFQVIQVHPHQQPSYHHIQSCHFVPKVLKSITSLPFALLIPLLRRRLRETDGTQTLTTDVTTRITNSSTIDSSVPELHVDTEIELLENTPSLTECEPVTQYLPQRAGLALVQTRLVHALVIQPVTALVMANELKLIPLAPLLVTLLAPAAQFAIYSAYVFVVNMTCLPYKRDLF